MLRLLLLAGVLLSLLVIAPAYQYPDFETPITQGNSFMRPMTPFSPETRVLGSWVALESIKNPNLDRVLWCESNGKHLNPDGTIIRGKDYEYGIAQFMWTTFYEFAERYNLKNPNIYNEQQQIWLANKMLNDGFGFHWSCY